MTTLRAIKTLTRLNLGCGRDLREGYVNVDLHGGDLKADLCVTPWPWADDSIEEVLMHHVLEHLPDTVSVMKELYRVCMNGALVHIAVPHPRHDDFISDPTHCSPITHRSMELFSKKQAPGTDTPLALQHNVDFDLVTNNYVIESRWMDRVNSGRLTQADLMDAIATLNNVVKQIEMTLRVVK